MAGDKGFSPLCAAGDEFRPGPLVTAGPAAGRPCADGPQAADGHAGGALSCGYACRPAAPYLAAPTYRRWRGCPSSRGAFSLQVIITPGAYGVFRGPDRFNGEETMTAAESAELAQRYDPRDVQEKWQAPGTEPDPCRASEAPEDPRERFYLVDMFPYPSGDLHMGHAEAYAIGDALARYHFLRGRNVLHPIGWDAFGLPAENAAIRNNTHPADWTYANIETQAASFRRYAASFDWSRRLQTCDPTYYRWNQWLFLRFYERALAYRRDGYVNWCPVDQTVLANEQVIAGKCEQIGR